MAHNATHFATKGNLHQITFGLSVAKKNTTFIIQEQEVLKNIFTLCSRWSLNKFDLVSLVICKLKIQPCVIAPFSINLFFTSSI